MLALFSKDATAGGWSHAPPLQSYCCKQAWGDRRFRRSPSTGSRAPQSEGRGPARLANHVSRGPMGFAIDLEADSADVCPRDSGEYGEYGGLRYTQWPDLLGLVSPCGICGFSQAISAAHSAPLNWFPASGESPPQLISRCAHCADTSAEASQRPRR